MRSLPVLLLSVLFALSAFAQPVAVNSLDSLVQVSQRYYNAQQPDSVYKLLTAEFKQQVSAADWRTFLSGTFARVGRWQTNEPIGQKEGFSGYKATFERGTLLFKIAADRKGQISGFGLSPYTPPTGKDKKLASSNPLQTRLDRQLDSVIRAHAAQSTAVGYSIGLLRNDSVFVYNYGETTTGTGQLPDGNTLFEIGSVSKTFTATLLADAFRKGLIQPNDPVNKYLPDSIPALQKDGVAISIQMLSNHTSGLPRLPGNMMVPGFTMLNPYQKYDRKALFSFLKTIPINDTPGTTYQYSNLGVGLLGTILELVTRQPYEQQLERVVTRPAHMVHTFIVLSASGKAVLAPGHTDKGQPTSNWDFLALAGAGAIRSTVNDLLLYVKAELGTGPKPLVESMQLTQQITFKKDTRTVGLGWHQNTIGKGVWLMHNGGTGGYVSFVGFNPANKTAVVMLSNTAAPIDAAAVALIKACRL